MYLVERICRRGVFTKIRRVQSFEDPSQRCGSVRLTKLPTIPCQDMEDAIVIDTNAFTKDNV